MVRELQDGFTPWPDDLAARYRALGYWEGRSLGDRLWEVADGFADRMALVDGASRFTYRELTDRADLAGARLLAAGLRRGDRLVVQLPNGWQFVVLTLACLRAGIAPVMALPGHRQHELGHLVALSEARAIAVPAVHRDFDHEALAHELRDLSESLEIVLTSGGVVRDGSLDLDAMCALANDDVELAEARAELEGRAPAADSIALFLLSGGTTGLPKLIPRVHEEYVYNALASAAVSGFGDDSVYLVALPAGHNFPFGCPGLIGTLLHGGRVVMVETPEPERAFEAIEQESVTHVAAVPAVAQRWIDHAAGTDRDLSSLRVLQVGGARIAEEVARRVTPALGCRLQQVFGMAEGLLNYTRLDDSDDIVLTTQGRPMCPDDEVRLVDPEDREVPQGQPGSLLTRGPYTLRGYYRADEHNTRAFTPDGWYRTGDICRADARGNLTVEGRDKDMINRGGEKVSAEEVENLLYALPQVRRCAAVAMPDPVLGERICVYVVTDGSTAVTLDDLRAAVLDQGAARFKLPEHLVIVDELPFTKVGKIDKRSLREDIVERLARDVASGAAS